MLETELQNEVARMNDLDALRSQLGAVCVVKKAR